MTYQVLARKWRPQDFSSLVGQAPIVTALRNALTEERIAQAYLFSGIRGVGKTTAARVLAKALNCERGPAADPCNECPPCLEITAGSDLDVIEVDAATYSKVEQVRDLAEGLKYGPARDRYKVVVIDEIHRLSRQAFDALLKIVEEPPPHLVFIFATTEIDAVPATILSRCQEFHFRRVPSGQVAELLRTLADHEEIQASDTALRLIARAGEGSVRDSVALLDQLATFGSSTIADEDAVRLLGGMDTALFEALLDAILAGDRLAVSAAVGQVEDEGWDPRHVFAQFLAYGRDALHLALGGDRERVDLPDEEAARLGERARAAGFENLLRLLQQLLKSEETVRRSDSPALALEIAWLRAAELPRLVGIERLLAGEGPPPAGEPAAPKPAGAARTALAKAAQVGAGTRAARASGGGDPDREAPPERSSPAAAPAPAEAPPAPGRQASHASPPPGGARDVEDFLSWVAERKTALAGHLRAAEALEAGQGELVVVAAPDPQGLLARRLERPENRRLIDEGVSAVWGEGTTWRLRQGNGRQTAPAEPAASSASGGAAGRARPKAGAEPAASRPEDPAEGPEHAASQAVLEIFQDTVERVDEKEE